MERSDYLWNEVTIFWNEVTVRWNEVTWNEVTMERSDRNSSEQTEQFIVSTMVLADRAGGMVQNSQSLYLFEAN